MKTFLRYSVIIMVLLNYSCTDDEMNEPPEFGTMSDIEGNIYKTVKIGNQIWMAENLKVTTYSDGTPIPILTDENSWSSDTIGACCWYYNRIVYKDEYGVLYNWFAIKTGKLCPEGWHIPSDSEWRELGNFLGENAGTKMKTETGWISNKGGATNSSGFSAVPSGWRFKLIPEEQSFAGLGAGCIWWSSSEHQFELSNKWGTLIFDDGSYYFGISPNIGCSVRCIKD